MGKKKKIGKQRQDKFYHLAKETGYRSRAAFKLIQLNRKFEFLARSRVLVDLCAAPGGWLQVAAQNMPVSSLIIGVDLVPIKPLPNVITLEEDITTDKCRQALKKHLKTWKADVVLNDGAPNVGKNWLHDAFQQAQLTMQALKLATNFLTKGGWFITKVFRSKDYHALMWVFKQFFKKVHATKPQASRTESAEIFVVCQNYLAPDKIDPKLLDVKYVFEEVVPEPKAKLNLMFPEKEKHRAEGYPEGETTLYHKVNVSQFITSSNYVELLNNCNELIFDEEKYENNKFTTSEIKECCKDIKVLGRKELKLLLSWRKKLNEEFHAADHIKPDIQVNNSSPVEDEETRIQHLIEEAQEEEKRELKRKKKKILKERQKLQEKMNLKMVLPNDEPIVSEDKSLFYLETIKNKKELAEVDKGSIKLPEAEDSPKKTLSRKTTVLYDKDEKNWDDMCSDEDISDRSEDEHSSTTDDDSDEEKTYVKTEDNVEKNPLLVDLDDDPDHIQKKKKVKLWFDKDIFSGIEKKSDETYELDQITEYFKKKTESTSGNKDTFEEKKETLPSDSTSLPVDTNARKGERKVEDEIHKASSRKRKELDVEGLALGTLMIHSQKKKRDIIDDSWNRYAFADENLPSWFKADEEKHNKKQLPVSKEMVEEFKQRLKEINARPIKKIAEAKARKKRKMMKKIEKARKKAEAITGSSGMTEVEKRHQVKAIYKKLMPAKKEEVTYVVAKKGAFAKRVKRPAGVKGRFKVVDPRMKKDSSRLKQKKTK